VGFSVSVCGASVVVKATTRHTTKSHWFWLLLETMSWRDMWCRRYWLRSCCVGEGDGYKMVRNHVTRAKEWQETGATSAAVTCDRARVVGYYACDGDIDLLTSVRSQSNDILYRERRSHAL
jgi:hypothetical protein